MLAWAWKSLIFSATSEGEPTEMMIPPISVSWTSAAIRLCCGVIPKDDGHHHLAHLLPKGQSLQRRLRPTQGWRLGDESYVVGGVQVDLLRRWFRGSLGRWRRL